MNVKTPGNATDVTQKKRISINSDPSFLGHYLQTDVWGKSLNLENYWCGRKIDTWKKKFLGLCPNVKEEKKLPSIHLPKDIPESVFSPHIFAFYNVSVALMYGDFFYFRAG